MTEWSGICWTTNGTGDGTETGYTQANWMDLFRMLFLSDITDEGVCKNYLNELNVTNPSGRTLSIDTGGAIVCGSPYINDSAISKTLTHPTIDTTGWRIVLRTDWTAQTVRVELKESADGTSTPPAVTQTANTIWEISLAHGTITTGDVVAVTDDRVFLHANIEVVGSMIAASSIEPTHIANRTRTFFVPVSSGYIESESTPFDQGYYVPYRGWYIDINDLTHVAGCFSVPNDFVSGMTVQPIVLSSGAGNLYIYQEARYGAVGETVSHSDTIANTTYPLTGTLKLENGGAALSLTNVAIGDYVYLVWARDATNPLDTASFMYFVGWLVSYTADS